MSDLCPELRAFEYDEADIYYCESCRKQGSNWLHLRKCQTCGKTLCCDDSPHQHARKHFEETGHPVVISAEPGEDWAYCYVHGQLKMPARKKVRAK